MRAGFAFGSGGGGRQEIMFYWAPVWLAVGIGFYFTLTDEPTWSAYALAGVGIMMALCGAVVRIHARRFYIALCIILCGFCLAGLRAHFVSAPVLEHRYYGPIVGRVVEVDRSASDKIRLTLAEPQLEDISAAATPVRIRVSLHDKTDPNQTYRPEIGQFVMTTGYLSPPAGRVEPGGFDFRRHAWFSRIGAQGYTRMPVLRVEGNKVGFPQALRQGLSERLRAAMPAETGHVAVALLTGDRSGLSNAIVDNLRASNLAHLLAISGLHMGLVAGLVFSAMRFGLAACPRLALRLPVRKVAALIALGAAAFYLLISGGAVATVRAFIMASVALIAIICDRRALSLRSVATAALIVLIFRPESLLSPGFQMSFAATTALVVTFSAISAGQLWLGPVWIRPVTTLLLSSFCAGLATAPIAAAHFNQIASFGWFANIVAVPLMGLVIMPAGIAGVLLMPFGGEGIPLWLMGLGLEWVLFVAHFVAHLPNARHFVAQPEWYVLPMLSMGALLLVLSHRRRMTGIALMCTACFLWARTDRPNILVADSGGLVGVMTAQGRALSAAKGDGFAARVWLENDGDSSAQEVAAQRWAALGGTDMPPIIALRGKRSAQSITDCPKNALVVSAIPVKHALPCDVIDNRELAQSGSVAISWDGKGWRRVANQQHRLWQP